MRYPHDHERDVIYFAKTNFRNQMRKFGIKTDDRRRHVYIIGKTGMGKTTLLENMILSDIYAGHGGCYVDPHGDTAEKLLDYIPSWRINDVVYFNPADLEHPVGFNILEAVDEDMKHLVAAGMMGVFKKIWENVWSARMEYILNNTILALMDTPGSTLLGINRVLSDKEYRKEIVANVKDPIVRQFWVKEFAGYADKFASEAVAPIQNKVGQFLSASVIRNIVAQAKSSVNIRKIMDEEKIFIVNLSKGRIGEDASRLLGGMIITKIQMSAMERVEIPEEERNDFYLYVDEFQNFAVESFASILSEARKYRLNLIMAHQYIAQLSEEVRDAVFGNVGTIITFRVGSPDAMFMEDEFMPRFLPEDIINLPKFSVYLKLMIDGVSSQPFSAATLPPIAHRTGSEQKVIEQSRERYAGKRANIEEHVEKWSGFGGDIDMGEAFDDALKEAKEKRKARFLHTYNCSRCNKEFSLPVELDRSRPIYCEECMPIVKEERQKGKKGGGRSDKGSRGGKSDKNSNKSDKPEKPPKPDEGELIVKEAEKEVSLDALKKDEKKHGGEQRDREQRDREQRDSGNESDTKRDQKKRDDKKTNEPKAGDVLKKREVGEEKQETERQEAPQEKKQEDKKPVEKQESGGGNQETEKQERGDDQPKKKKRKRRRRKRNKKSGGDGQESGSNKQESGNKNKDSGDGSRKEGGGSREAQSQDQGAKDQKQPVPPGKIIKFD